MRALLFIRPRAVKRSGGPCAAWWRGHRLCIEMAHSFGGAGTDWFAPICYGMTDVGLNEARADQLRSGMGMER
jgi:hypothetical protein